MILIKNAHKLYTMGPQGILENADILINGKKIVKVGKNICVDKDVQVIDATNKYVYPGFIDAHCHIGMFEEAIGFEGNDGNEITNPITPELRAIDGINPMDISLKEALMGGVTTASTGPGSANVLGGQFTIIKLAGRRVDDMIVKAYSAMKCAFGENPKRCYQGKGPETRMATASKLRETLYKAKEYMEKKEKAEDESKLPAFNMQYEALIPVLKREVPLKAHAHRADDIFTSIRIAKEFNLLLTLDHCTEGHLIADILAKENYPAIVGPSFGNRSKFELKEKTFKTAKILQEAGVKVAINTDSPVIPLQHLNMCASYAVNAGMDPYEALKAITINPAEILGVADRIGSIEENKDADIVIWSGDALNILNKVEMTILDGEIVYKE
ncbi:MAG TPA: amidohydrolase [Haloplasmataceae bacterium]